MSQQRPVDVSHDPLDRSVARDLARHLGDLVAGGVDQTEAAAAMLAVGAIALGIAEGRPQAAARALSIAYGLLQADATDEAIAEMAANPGRIKQ